MLTRAEHLEWCKQRALELVLAGRLDEAFTSMASDLRKHPETADHRGCELGLMMLMAGRLGTPKEMREFIQGFG